MTRALPLLMLGACLAIEPITPARDGPSGATGESGMNGSVSPIPRSCPRAVPDTASPVLFFSDLSSGPVSGGEGDLGVFLSLYGKRFGQSGSVSIGGVAVARIVAWGEAAPARGLERIVVQPGPAVVSGEIVVEVDGHKSNPLDFQARSGKLALVDASVATSGDGSFSSPWKTVSEARAVGAGATVYIKNNAEREALDLSGSAPGTAQAPIAYIGYPGQTAQLGRVTLAGTGANAFTFANLKVQSDDGFIVSVQQSGLRIVANRFLDVSGDFRGVINLGARTQQAAILGNFFEQGDGNVPAVTCDGLGTEIEIAWNEIADSNIISLRGELSQSRIHGNLFRKQIAGIDIGFAGSFDQVRFDNNIIIGTSFFTRPSGTAGSLVIAHNTWADTKAIYVNNPAPPAGVVRLENNILSSDGAYIQTENDLSFATPSNNLYDTSRGNAPLPYPSEPGHIADNPVFVSVLARDYHLSEFSPAIDKGTDAGTCDDFDGLERDASPDIGAFERR